MHHDNNIVVSTKEQQEIIDWANQNYQKFIPNGISRQYHFLDFFDDIPESVWHIKQRIVEKEELHDYQTEPTFRDFIGYITDCGKIHPHIDLNVEEYIHTRFNVFIQLPEKGGLPIYNDKIVAVNELEYVKCYSGLYKHHCQKVEGTKARIVLSYGFLIPTHITPLSIG
jgi:hypothetical protein